MKEYYNHLTLYQFIQELLATQPELRKDNKKLVWEVWGDEEVLCLGTSYDPDKRNEMLTYENFLKATSPHTIIRTKEKIQKEHPELK